MSYELIWLIAKKKGSRGRGFKGSREKKAADS